MVRQFWEHCILAIKGSEFQVFWVTIKMSIPSQFLGRNMVECRALPSFVIEEDSIVMTFPKTTKSDLDVMVEFLCWYGNFDHRF